MGTFFEYQTNVALLECTIADTRLFLANALRDHAREMSEFPPDNKLRTAGELMEYRFADNVEDLTFKVEQGVLYAICSGDMLFWRVHMEVDGVLPELNEVEMSESLREFLDGRTEVQPIRVPWDDPDFTMVFAPHW